MYGFVEADWRRNLFPTPVLKMKKEVTTSDRLLFGDWDIVPLINRLDLNAEVKQFLYVFMKSGYISNNPISFIARLVLREFDGLASKEISKGTVLGSKGLLGSVKFLVSLSTVSINQHLYIRRSNYLLSSYMQESIRDCMEDLRIPADQTTLPEYMSAVVSLILEVDQVFLRLINFIHQPDAEHLFIMSVEESVLDIEYKGTRR